MPRLPRYRPVGKPVTYLCRLGQLSEGKPPMAVKDRRELLGLLLSAGQFYGYEVFAFRIGRESASCVVHHDGKKATRAEAIRRIANYYGEELGERARGDQPDKITAGHLQRALRDYGDLAAYIQRVKGGFSAFYSKNHPEVAPSQLWRDRYRIDVVQEDAGFLLAACAEVEKDTGAGRQRDPARDRFCSFGAATAGDAKWRQVIRQLTNKRGWPTAAATYQESIDQAQPSSKTRNRYGRKGVFGDLQLEKLITARANQPRSEIPKPRSKLTPPSEHLAALRRFKERFGHTRVPLNWQENTKLATWIHARRSLYRRGKLSTEVITELNRLGFDWDLPRGRNSSFDKISAKLQPELYLADAAWVEHLEELKVYVGRNGHLEVTSSENHKLYRWFYNQKRRWKAGKLNAEKKRLLKALGVKTSHLR
jgi:hypothetical protein